VENFQLPGQPVTCINEGRVVGKLEEEQIVDGNEAAIKKDT
jgi:hypothetical protein